MKVKMTEVINHTMALEDLEKYGLEDVLREVFQRRETLFVRLPGGEMVIIQPTPPLKPLPVLAGYIPEGWKDAIYE